MTEILRDIREAHKTDMTTADIISPAAEAQKKLQEVMQYEGSEQEKKVRIFCAQLGINYDKLTKEEFVMLIGLLKKSEHMKSPYNQRGKGNMAHGKGKRKRK